jgi:hypothetical protein
MPRKHLVAPSLVAVVNVGRTWPDVERGLRAPADVILGDWNPFKGSSSTRLAFDPATVELVLGYYHGDTADAFDVDPERPFVWLPSYTPQRIRWNGSASSRWAHLKGTRSPVIWKQGEGTPVKIITLAELEADDAIVREEPQGKRAVLGDATVSLVDTGVLVVTVPAGHEVIVRTNA